MIRCASNVRQFGIISNVYFQDHGEFVNGHFNRSSIIPFGTHQLLRNDYGINGGLVYCPSNEIIDNSRNWDTSNSTGGTATEMTYWYFAGFGNRTTGTLRNGWLVSSFPHLDEGFYAVLNPDDTVESSRVPMMTDLMYHPAQQLDNNLPQVGNHGDNSGIASKGGNVLFVDGHAAYQDMIPGTSWLLNDTPYGGATGDIYWNPGFTPKAAPTYLP